MGSGNSRQHGHTTNPRRRTTIKKVLRLTSNSTARPMSYAGINQEQDDPTINRRPLSMYDAIPFANLDERVLSNPFRTNLIDSTSQTSDSNPTALCSDTTCEKRVGCNLLHKSSESFIFDENNWKFYLPLTLEKIRQHEILREFILPLLTEELLHVLTRLLRLENLHEDDEIFLEWFFDELEFFLNSIEDNCQSQEKSLLIRSVEQDRFDCMKYLFDHQLFPSKLTINTINDQGRHCLLMLAHRNGPLEAIEYLLKRQLTCLDTNKFDWNQFSALHHACRHFNLSICELLLPHTHRKVLQMENSELHTPLDYWLECLCSLKKLKPTHMQYHSDSLRLDHLLNDSDYCSNVFFFQNLINRGGQLTKFPLRYIRSILPQLTFEQKLSYVDHHVHLCCTLYKNRLSTLIRDYDNMKISIQAGEILTEFIYALGAVQIEVQNRLAAHAYSSVYETAIQRIYRQDQAEENDQPTAELDEARQQQSKLKEQETLQSTMRMLYFKFFRLFQCIYSNPDVNVKNFHFEHIFRRVWIYWKEPVRVFLGQCREKNSSLKSQCRILIFRHLINYPTDIQSLPINTALKQFLTYDNRFFLLNQKF